jgi:hypothetical protein
MSTLAYATRSYTPLAFRPPVERLLAVALSLAAVTLWVIVVPLEFVLA